MNYLRAFLFVLCILHCVVYVGGFIILLVMGFFSGFNIIADMLTDVNFISIEKYLFFFSLLGGVFFYNEFSC
ncbi:MAG: hypothetical protein ACOC4B_00835 [Bacteroidota bacterium]